MEDTPLYYMYEDDTMDMEGGLSEKTEGNEIPLMDTWLDRQVQTPEVNDNYVNYSVMLPIWNTYARWKVI